MVYGVLCVLCSSSASSEFDGGVSDVSLALCSSANLSSIRGGISAVSSLLEEIISTKQMRI